MSYTIPQMAAYVDGEGSFGIGKSEDNYAVYAQVVNTFLPVLQHFQATFGGKISISKKYKEYYKQGYQWQLHGSFVIPYLEALIPHLWEKKPQAELLLEYCFKFSSNPRTRGRWKHERLEQEWYYNRLRELKQEQTTVEETSRPEEPAIQLRLVI